MTFVAIMQPTYLPWIGYFHLIQQSDKFVLLDNVKIEKSSWQTRNKILIGGQPRFITVPIEGSRTQLINEAKINDKTNWRKKHLASIMQNYSKHLYYEWMVNIIQPVIENEDITKLCELNVEIIKAIGSSLNIRCNYIFASDLPTKGKKSQRLIEICQLLSADIYLSPIGSKGYIEEESLFKKHEIPVQYQDITLLPYNQNGQNIHVSNLSIIDIMANEGCTGVSNYLSGLNAK